MNTLNSGQDNIIANNAYNGPSIIFWNAYLIIYHFQHSLVSTHYSHYFGFDTVYYYHGFFGWFATYTSNTFRIAKNGGFFRIQYAPATTVGTAPTCNDALYVNGNGVVTLPQTTPSSSTTTGALVTGGVGLAGNLNVEEQLDLHHFLYQAQQILLHQQAEHL